MRLTSLLLSSVLAGSAMLTAQQAAKDPALQLSTSMQEAAARYATDADRLRAATNRAAVCSLVDEAKQVGRALSRTLDRRRDSIVASDLDQLIVSTAGTASAAQQREAFDASVRILAHALPGALITDGNAVRFGPDYTAIGELANSIPEKKLLQAAGNLLASGSSVTFTQPADARCSDLSATTTAVQTLVKSWASSSKCLQDSIADELNARVGEISAARYPGAAGASFCGTKEEAAVIGARLAELISQHAYLGGQPGADFLRESLAAPSTHYVAPR